MYYIMGIHSKHDYFKKITKLGFFNPRLNTAYTCSISAVSKETITEIENVVICYNEEAPAKNQTSSSKKETGTFNNTEYTVSDVCFIAGVKKSAVYKDIHEGRLNASKKGNRYVITKEELDRYIEKVKAAKEKVLGALFVWIAITFIVFLLITAR